MFKRIDIILFSLVLTAVVVCMLSNWRQDDVAMTSEPDCEELYAGEDLGCVKARMNCKLANRY